jgi:hypothetical protein
MLSKSGQRRACLDAVCGLVVGPLLFASWLVYAHVAMSKFGFVVFPAYAVPPQTTGLRFVIYIVDTYLIRTGWLLQGFKCALIGALVMVSCGYLYRRWRADTGK